jgi:F-type H+-transporting ATPase subunit delta
MAEPSTVARPYAEAVFKLADAAGALTKWSEMLAALAAVAADARIQVAIKDPNLSAPKVAGLFIAILAGKLSGDAENLVRLLAEYGRLELLPEVREQFEALKNEREGVVEAEIQSAIKLTEAQVGELVARLEKKFSRKIKTKLIVDQELIGGVLITVGDKVIDGSVRGELAALENALKA